MVSLKDHEICFTAFACIQSALADTSNECGDLSFFLHELGLYSVEVIRADEEKAVDEEDDDEDKLVRDDVDNDEADEYGLQGRIRITTRCLWTDNNKLLESLQRAADVALASCRKDARLSTIERHVSVVLRKVVQKYSNKRPDVIVIATDASEGVTPNRGSAETLNSSSNSFDQSRNKQQPWKRAPDDAKSKFFRGPVGGTVEPVELESVKSEERTKTLEGKTQPVPETSSEDELVEEEAGSEPVTTSPESLAPEGTSIHDSLFLTFRS